MERIAGHLHPNFLATSRTSIQAPLPKWGSMLHSQRWLQPCLESGKAAFGLQHFSAEPWTGNIIVRDEQVENITVHIQYLGSVKNSDGRCTAGIVCRIGLAASAMRSFQTLWHQQRIQLSTELQLYCTCYQSSCVILRFGVFNRKTPKDYSHFICAVTIKSCIYACLTS